MGKTANCQVAVSLSLATTRGSVPIGYQLYLPKEWAEDEARRNKTGVPAVISFATKPQIELAQLPAAVNTGVPPGGVLADAAYGDDTAFRDGITAFHHHATLCIAAYGFLTAHRLTHDDRKKTALNQKRLPYPRITSLADARRAQRHVPDSIRTLRRAVAQAIANRVPRCPCCGVLVRHDRV